MSRARHESWEQWRREREQEALAARDQGQRAIIQPPPPPAQRYLGLKILAAMAGAGVLFWVFSETKVEARPDDEPDPVPIPPASPPASLLAAPSRPPFSALAESVEREREGVRTRTEVDLVDR